MEDSSLFQRSQPMLLSEVLEQKDAVTSQVQAGEDGSADLSEVETLARVDTWWPHCPYHYGQNGSLR